MPRVLNLGSLNIDHVYRVPHFVRPGETLSSHLYSRFAGGKGLNQSIALAHGGAEVTHAGRIHRDDVWLRDLLAAHGVGTGALLLGDTPSGHAIIQVSDAGENAIVLYGGANQELTAEDVETALQAYGPGDVLVLQNETSSVADALRLAKARGLTVVFNPAPMAPSVRDLPLDLVDWLVVNETEAEALVGAGDLPALLQAAFPQTTVVLTLGSKGAYCLGPRGDGFQAAMKVKAVDTTAAGDTFLGFFVAAILRGATESDALALGCRAAAFCVTRPGAAGSIPTLAELKDWHP
jgi:ribokinase